MTNKAPVLALLFAAAFSGPALAHHSFAMFDAEKDVTIEGEVIAYSWFNPHVWIDVMVSDGRGAQQRWGLESQSLGILARLGWRQDSMKAGDRVLVDLHPMKDGTPGGQVMKVTLPDGKVLLTGMARR